VEPFGEGVYLVSFSVPARYTKFLPGQFLHLTLDEFDPTTGYWPESRVFSIASEPRRETLTIVYSVKGRYTARMERELAVGREVWLKLPYGDFIISESLLAAGPVVLLAGGTGVSPYLPFLKTNTNRVGSVHLYYGIRKTDHLLFEDVWKGLEPESWFRLHLMIEEGSHPSLPFESGRLSIRKVSEDLGDTTGSASYFLSGPPAMIQAFRKDLASFGVSPQNVHVDEWE
jgi:ferredoxin-NADP reductase